MDNRFFNKRGDITTTILVIGVILVCAIGIATFFYSTIKIRSSFIGIDLTENLSSQIEQRAFSGESSDGLKKKKNETQGFLWWSKEVLLFSIKYNQGS